ncbi:MAG: SCO family protein [Candidatus Acidiferrales bacterium]
MLVRNLQPRDSQPGCPLARNIRLALIAAAAVVALTVAPCARAQVQTIGIRPQLLRDVGVDQKLNNQVPLDLPFRDEHGNAVTLGKYFGSKPVILTLVYYQCPMLCTQVLDGVLQTIKEVPLRLGKDFRIVTVSIDPRDRPVEAQAKQLMYTSLYGSTGLASGWHFLTGNDLEIHHLADAVGFRYAYDSVSGQYAHPSVIMVLTPGGKVSRYFYGISFPSRDVRLGLVEASHGRIGSPVMNAILLYCYHYDPNTGKYGVMISRILRAAGVITILGIFLLIFILRRQEHYSLPEKRA